MRTALLAITALLLAALPMATALPNPAAPAGPLPAVGAGFTDHLHHPVVGVPGCLYVRGLCVPLPSVECAAPAAPAASPAWVKVDPATGQGGLTYSFACEGGTSALFGHPLQGCRVAPADVACGVPPDPTGPAWQEGVWFQWAANGRWVYHEWVLVPGGSGMIVLSDVRAEGMMLRVA